MPAKPRHIRIFLSSPGDVPEERAAAFRIIDNLPRDPLLKGKITTEIIAWDEPGLSMPLLATMTPQEAINQGMLLPADCDFVVAIFWSRMGTPLPETYKKADGSRYQSGTEWEYHNAVEAAHQSAQRHERPILPQVIVYRRTGEPTIEENDPVRADKLAQLERMKAFFASFTNADGSIQRGYNPYKSVEEFAQQFDQHIKRLIDLLLTTPERSEKMADPIVTTITPDQAADQERRAILQIETDIQNQSRAAASAAPTRFINPLPQDVGDRFKDRSKAQADIMNLLIEKTRLISVYGRGGIGKTALVSKVLGDLQQAKTGVRPAGMIYLSAISTGISLDRIFNDFGKLLTGTIKESLETIQHDTKLTVNQRVSALLHVLGSDQVVLLLDNLETLQEAESGQLTDPEMQAFLETVAGQTSALRLIITSREPIGLPRALKPWERIIALDQGLPAEDGAALLRSFDPDGIAGLRDAAADQLALVVERTGGYPRALEAVVGLLLEDPLLSLDDLLQDLTLFTGEITPVIVQQAIASLSPDALRVMEGLALFRQPVSQTALAFLLAPYFDTSGLRAILARLVRGYFASYNKATQEFAIHQIDQAYCYSRIPEGTPADLLQTDLLQTPPPYTRTALHHRAAEFYIRQRKPEDDWQTFDDLAPHLAEFEHRVSAGEYDTAASVLHGITLDYLFVWGFFSLVVKLADRLQGKLTDDQLKQRNVHLLGIAYSNLGQIQKAITCFEESLTLARQIGNRRAEGGALNNLGWSYNALAQTSKAVNYFEQSLAIAQETGNRRGEGQTLNNLGLSYADLGQMSRAVEYFGQALTIARETDNPALEGLAICNLGKVLIDEGRFTDAIQRVGQAVTLNETLNSPELGSYSHLLIAAANLYLGNLPTARQSAELARTYDDPDNNHDVLVLCGITAVQQGDPGAAKIAFEAVTKIDADVPADKQDFTLLIAKALAWCGLILVQPATPVASALAACQIAQATNHDPGVIAHTARIFDTLAKADSTGVLALLRTALIGTDHPPAEFDRISNSE